MRRFLIIFVSLIVVLCILVSAFGLYTVRRSFPQIKGEIKAQSLDGTVDVYRDEFGVPHIYATTEHDLFFAQGYIHAQDRFWQMDFWRHIGSGRLSEMFGASQLDTDKFLRTLGWARIAQQELDAIDPDFKAVLQAYADGVNAYLSDQQGSELSLEYAILKLLNAGYKPEPWQPLHTLTWGKAMAWDLGGNMDKEINRAILLKTLTPEQMGELYPTYPTDHPYILPEFQLGKESSDRELATGHWTELAEALEKISKKSAALDKLIGPRGSGIGSNSWVISGKLTTTGKPLLANDTHLPIQMPSIWYEIGLHCQLKGPDCSLNVGGFSFAGVPGVVIGHNDRIAWGMTNVGPDVQDLFIEKINPENSNQYEVNGQWKEMELVTETIQVAGGEAVELTVRNTRNGPIISEVYGALEDFSGRAGVEFPEMYAIALKWTALEPSRIFSAIRKMNLAQNWDEFRTATQDFNVPSQNLIYADVEGNIGYQTPGKIPIRKAGDGRLPVPGWTDEYIWQGYVPFEEMPFAFNPPQAYIATANNAVVSPDYPYIISTDWDLGFRAARIVEMIEGAPGLIDSAYIQKMHGDNKNLNAETLLPVLMALELNDAHLEKARSILQGWDMQQTMDSAPAVLFEVFWKNLLEATFHDDLPEEQWPEGGDRWFEVMRRIVPQEFSNWWDDRNTAELEQRDQIFHRAFAAAVDELENLQGKDPAGWNWGKLHGAVFRNQSLGESGVAPIEALFNRGPFPTAGGESIVNANGWNALEPYQLNWLPSKRMIVDLGGLQNSLSIHTTGQSGHAYHPHYIDMVDMWRTIQYHPMLWEQAQVQASAEGWLKLVP